MVKRVTETLVLKANEEKIYRKMYVELDKPVDRIAFAYALITTCKDAAIINYLNNNFLGNKNAISHSKGLDNNILTAGEAGKEMTIPESFEEYKKSEFSREGFLAIGNVSVFYLSSPRFSNIVVFYGAVTSMKNVIKSIINARVKYNECYTEQEPHAFETKLIMGYTFDKYGEDMIHYSATIPAFCCYKFIEDLAKMEKLANLNVHAMIYAGKEIDFVKTTLKSAPKILGGKRIESISIKGEIRDIRIHINSSDCENVIITVIDKNNDIFSEM